MKKISILTFLMLASFFVFLWMGVFTFLDVKKYLSLNEKTYATIGKWEILEKKKGFFIVSNYSYLVGKDTFFGKTIFKQPKFLNYFSACDVVNKWSLKKWNVYYFSKDVKKSSLEKNFPLKNCIYSFISFLIFLYFFILKKNILKFEI